MNSLPLFKQGDERDALKKRCRAKGIKIQTLEDLVDVELIMVGKGKRKGLYERFTEIFDEEINS